MSQSASLILTINAGSSSLKVSVFNAETLVSITQFRFDISREGESSSGDATNHAEALDRILENIDLGSVSAVGHRIVHGGTRFTAPTHLSPDVRGAIADLGQLAPNHHPAALAVIDRLTKRLPDVPQVVTFDTLFHATMPEVNYRLAIPERWSTEWGIRRFGFHGLSHANVAQRAKELVGDQASRRTVSCHLGAGASLCAIRDGESVHTTMGFTPFDGVPMATRSGSLDPGVILHALRNTSGLEEVERALQSQSGLRGLSGATGDMRTLIERRAKGDAASALAIDVYCARIQESVAAMASSIGGLDCVAFTGGVGEHAAPVRHAIVAGLSWLGVSIDKTANERAERDADISGRDSRARVLVIETREDMMVADAVKHLMESIESVD